MIVLYLCLSISVVAAILMKFIVPDEIHQILVVLSGSMILAWVFLLTPFSMKLLISLTLFAICQRIYEITLKP